MRHMCEADKVWFRQEIRAATRQVLYEEFGEVMQFLRYVKEKGDMDAVAGVAEAGTQEAEDAEDCSENVGREQDDQDVPVLERVKCKDCTYWRPDCFYTVLHTSRYFPKNPTGYGLCFRLGGLGPVEVGGFRRLVLADKDSLIVVDSVILCGQDYGCIYAIKK